MADIIQIKQEGVDQYPITKPECVIDENGKTIQQMMAKWGVVSQKQTWTQASDGGYDYVMSDLVRGWIPQANIDLFVSAGAVFNEETGYFELNGLTDISYQEMQKIYYQSHPFIRRMYLDEAFAGTSIRTNLFIWDDFKNSLYGGLTHTHITLRATCARSAIEVFAWMNPLRDHLAAENYMEILTTQSMFNTYGTLTFSKVIGAINMRKVTNASEMFFGQASLEEVSLKNIGINLSFAQSPRLSYDSIKYLIKNSAATSAITVTLHATALANAETAYLADAGQDLATYPTLSDWALSKNIQIATA